MDKDQNILHHNALLSHKSFNVFDSICYFDDIEIWNLKMKINNALAKHAKKSKQTVIEEKGFTGIADLKSEFEKLDSTVSCLVSAHQYMGRWVVNQLVLSVDGEAVYVVGNGKYSYDFAHRGAIVTQRLAFRQYASGESLITEFKEFVSPGGEFILNIFIPDDNDI